MRTSNGATGALRAGEVGQLWEEKLTNVAGTIQVPRYSTFRVRAAAALTVTIDGVLAMSMASGEIATFNAGEGDPTQPAKPCSVVVSGLAYVQVGREVVLRAN